MLESIPEENYRGRRLFHVSRQRSGRKGQAQCFRKQLASIEPRKVIIHTRQAINKTLVAFGAFSLRFPRKGSRVIHPVELYIRRHTFDSLCCDLSCTALRGRSHYWGMYNQPSTRMRSRTWFGRMYLRLSAACALGSAGSTPYEQSTRSSCPTDTCPSSFVSKSVKPGWRESRRLRKVARICTQGMEAGGRAGERSTLRGDLF